MPAAQNPIANMYQTQLEASRRFADVVFSGTEKIDHVVIEATHRAFSDQLDFVEEFASTRDPSEAVNLQSNFFSQSHKNAVICQKEIMRIFAEVQNEMSRSMRDYLGKFRSTADEGARTSMRDASRGVKDDSSFINPITGMFSVWESAFKEVALLADKNMNVARSNVEELGQIATEVVSKSSENVANAAKTVESNMEKGNVTDVVSKSQDVMANVAKTAESNVEKVEGSFGSSQNVPLSTSVGHGQSYSSLEGGESAEDRKSPLGGGKRK